ncbi:hypothetical protein [Alkaliphilus hydrothermalis]|uniref:Uncharacterized protein n=1 Tax=Alkaliphilus hydrothermalis TaxID=1482730 RepID=A0ABS2NMH0_9FIRM|nr:hypothetical protein [Alkaliphilus hydrothermalis]MBM7614128.1 hypothetical protein [Alkaliphilus hydrothermalis]
MNIYYVDPSFTEVRDNPYRNNLPYTDDWIMLKLLETSKGFNLLQYLEGEVSRLIISKEGADWEYQLFDFIQYHSSYNKNILLAVDKKDLDTAQHIYGNHSYKDRFLRPYEGKVLIHTTSKENYNAIMQDGYLKSWNRLNRHSQLTEKAPIGQVFGDPPDYSDYIMFTNGGLGAERVVASRQKGKIDLNFDSPYMAGARFYFDADKIAKDGLLVRDGRHLKVRDSLSINSYILWIATPDILGISEETTPRIFTEKANTMFEKEFGISV